MNKFEVRDLNLYYGQFHALKGVSMDIPEKEVTAFIGPSGCGKSTFLKTLNRMNDLVEGCRITGDVKLDGVDIFKDKLDVNVLRKRVGMVFQKPNPFPMSIYDNIAYGPRTHGIRNKAQLDEIVERSLRGAAIWDEVKDRLKKSALGMSRRPAAAPVHRPRPGRGAGSPADGRAHFRPGPHLHQPRGGAGHGPEEGLHHRHRHPQHAAGRPYLRTRPPSSCWASWWRWAPPSACSPPPSDKRTEDYISGRFG